MTNFKVGDFIKTTTKSGNVFESIILKKMESGFVCKIISKDPEIGQGSWERYGLFKDGRVQSYDDCSDITLISESKEFLGKSRMTLQEGVRPQEDKMTFYRTKINESTTVTLCLCDNYGGWSFDSHEDLALKESYLDAKLAEIDRMEK